MPIDWFTVTAQTLNFVVLVWLLKRYLYGPILRAVDAREKRVADELADAASKQAEARQERDDFARRNADFDQQRDARLAQVHAQAAQERQQLLEQARADARAWSARRQTSLRAEAMQQGHVIREQVQQEVFAIARKTLQDLASEALEQRVCDLFVERLRGLDAAQRAALASTVGADAAPVQVRSAFELATPQREAMTAALHEVLGQDQPVQYSCSPALVSGIELLGGGHKIDWNIGDYLDAMENKVAQRLQQLGEPGADDAAPVAAGDGAAEVEQESATAPSDPGGATAGEGAVADAGHSR